MRLEAREPTGLFLVHFERHTDARGWFQRIYDRELFERFGLVDCSTQCSLSWNPRQATLRGLHFQREPHGETKLVRCLQGSVFDVVVDVRPHSSTFGKWSSCELSATAGVALYIPRGFAHGFFTLEDATLMQYQIADPFVPEASKGINWEDPDLAIRWPGTPLIVDEKDLALPRFAAITSARE